MTKIPFTPEQKEALQRNPFTLSVNDYQIRFTVEFKKFLLSERQKNGTPWREIFRKAGYDPDIFQQTRIDSIVHHIKLEAESPKGLHETASSRLRLKEDQYKQDKKAIQDLQKEVLRLQQQVEFLKKMQMLKVLEDNEK